MSIRLTVCLPWLSSCLLAWLPACEAQPQDVEKPQIERQERAPQFQQDQPEVELSAADVQRLVSELDAADFRVRLNATKVLQQAGSSVIPALERAMRTGSLEVVARCTALLRREYIRQQHDAVSPAEQALEKLAEDSPTAAAAAALAVLEENYELRDRRTLEVIRKLGGAVKFHESGEIILGRGNIPGAGFGAARSVAYILLGNDWEGGEDGLKYLRRLSSLSTLYVIDGTQISQENLDRLYDRFPGLRVQYRGRAYLGIGSDRPPLGGAGCLVTRVEPGQAAQKAGMLIGDVIQSFDGTAVASFDDLIESIKKKNADDEVVVQILRNGARMELNVKLGRWNP